MSDLDDDLLLHDPDEAADDVPGDAAHVEHGAVDDDHQPSGDEAHPVDSPFARLKAAQKRRQGRGRLVMEMPGWDGELLVEFKLLARREAKRLRSATRSARDDMAKVVADLLCASSQGLMVYNDDGNPVPLMHRGRRQTFADVDQFVPDVPVQSERQGFLALFLEGDPPELNEIALQAFADRVGRWMADTSIRPEGAVDLTVDESGAVVGEEINPGS